MSKKKLTARSTMPLKDFTGGQTVADLPLPSAPGGSKERPHSFSSGLGGYGMGTGTGPSGKGTPSSPAVSSALIGRHFSEDERKSSSSPWGGNSPQDDPLPGQGSSFTGSVSAPRNSERPRVASYSRHLTHGDTDCAQSAAFGMATPVVGKEWKMYGTDVNFISFKSNLVSKPREPEPERKSSRHSAPDSVRGHQGVVPPKYSTLARGDRETAGSHTGRGQEAVAPVTSWQASKHSEEQVDKVAETRSWSVDIASTTGTQEQKYKGRHTSVAASPTQGAAVEKKREELQAHGRDKRSNENTRKAGEPEKKSESLALTYGYGMGAADWDRPKSSALLKSVAPSATSLISRQPNRAEVERHNPEAALIDSKQSEVDSLAEADKYIDPRDSNVEEMARLDEGEEEEEQSNILGWEEMFTGEEEVAERPGGRQTAVTDLVAGNVSSSPLSPASPPAATVAGDGQPNTQPTSSSSSCGEWVTEKRRSTRHVSEQGSREADTWRRPKNPPRAPPALMINSALVKPSNVNNPKKGTGLGVPSALELAEAFSRTNFSRPTSDVHRRGISNLASTPGNVKGSGSFWNPGASMEGGFVGRSNSGPHDGSLRREGSATRGRW